MIGYGSLESSGQYCTGRHLQNDESDTEETAESGALQTSYNTVEGPKHEPLPERDRGPHCAIRR
jgi:hypothetical protein